MIINSAARGAAQPIKEHDTVVCLKGCPDCEGRGWFLINPFATGGTNGAGGISNMCQCQTCLRAKEFWDQYGTLPLDIQARMKKANAEEAKA